MTTIHFTAPTFVVVLVLIALTLWSTADLLQAIVAVLRRWRSSSHHNATPEDRG